MTGDAKFLTWDPRWHNFLLGISPLGLFFTGVEVSWALSRDVMNLLIKAEYGMILKLSSGMQYEEKGWNGAKIRRNFGTEQVKNHQRLRKDWEMASL